MIDHIGKTTAEIAWNRLSACYLPPEVSDVKLFRMEFISAVSGFASEVVTNAVSGLLKNRKPRSFPSIGEVCEACREQYPDPPRKQPLVESYYVEDDRRDAAIGMLANMAGIDRVIDRGVHVMGLDFVMREGRLPTRDEWIELGKQVERANELLLEADNPPEDWREFRIHITQTAAGALRYRREKVAQQINEFRMKEAAE